MRARRSRRLTRVAITGLFVCSIVMVPGRPAAVAASASAGAVPVTAEPPAVGAAAPASDRPSAPSPRVPAPDAAAARLATDRLSDGPLPPGNGAPAGQPPVATAGADQTVPEGSMVTLDGGGSADPDGDLLTYAWTISAHTGPAIVLTSANAPVARFTASDDGVYQLALAVSDGTTTATDDVVITVQNAPPVVAAHADPTYKGGVSVVTATVTDAGLLDTQMATVTWGDGTPADHVAPSGQGAGWATVVASHAYAAIGTYLVTVSVADDDGGVASTTLTEQVLTPVALWANGTVNDPVLEVSGTAVTITGLTHSNSDLRVSGSADTFNGPTEYVRNLSAGKGAIFNPAPVRTAVQPIPVRFDIADYRPGGRASRIAGAAYRDMSSACKSGNWSVTGNTLASGVYYANCGIRISGSPTVGTITLAAEGDIVVSGSSAFFDPYMDGLLFITASTSAQAIKFDGSQSTFIGHSHAERGRIILAGSNNTFDCGLLGDRIQIPGSNIAVRASACAAPGRTGLAPTIVPTLTTALTVNRADTLPGQTLTHTAAITNAAASLVVTGVTGLENLGTSTVTVTGHTVALEYRSTVDGLWHPVPGHITISVRPDAAAGAAYPSTGDRIDGTTVAPGAVASWGLTAVTTLTPADVRLLLDPAKVAALRLGSTLAVSPTGARVRRLAPLDEDLATALRATGDNVTGITATIVPPAGAPHAFSAPTTPALALLGPGDAALVALDSTAPAPLPRAIGEPDAAYLARLATFDGALLTGIAFATGTTSAGPVATPPDSAVTTEHLPIVHITKTGPATADAGTSVTYDLALSNTGSAAASSLDATDMAGATPATVSDVPATLAPDAAATAHASFDIPDTTPDGDLVDHATVNWHDANGTTYGPVDSTFTTTVRGVHAVVPIQPVAIGPVSGNFYPNSGIAHFTATPASTPAFGQDFPTIDFNPPAGTVLNNISGVDPSTRPFTDLTTDVNGNLTGTIVAAGNGHQAGLGDLTHFDAVFTSTFAVTQASDVTFSVFSDAGFILGVGGGATRVNGALENPPASGTTPFQAYPVVGAYNLDSAPLSHLVTIHFPAAGSYPFELDYFECCDARLSLTLTTVSFIGDQSPLSIYVGYADGLRPGGSVFPFPWKGSSGVVFIGDNGTYDSGALRFDNSSDVPIVLDKVTVEVAGHVFDLWGTNRAVPAHGTLIMAQTSGENFDSSDVRGGTCTPIGTIPHVRVTVGGVLTTYNDTKQVLNTGDIDFAVCPGGGNESHAWERIGGGGTQVNHALPPQTSLTIDPNTASATVGLEQSLVVTAMDAGGSVIAGLPVTVRVFGANSGTIDATTDSAGVATVHYIGTASGIDQVQARAFVSGLLAISDVSTITWANPLVPDGDPGGGNPSPFPPPSIGGVSPADGTAVTEPVAIKASITPPAGETITDWQVSYSRPGTNGSVTLGSGTGAPPSSLAVFDPTTIPNGTYLIAVKANASGGGFQTSVVTLIVDGGLKLGRYVTSYLDLAVPINDLPMQVLRTYDSTDKVSRDFGVGWRVELSNFRVSTGRPLGLGGWTQYNKQCFFALCITGYTSSIPHVATVTWPDGHQELFDFTPDGGSNIFWFGSAKFTPRPRTTSTLEVDGDNTVSFFGGGNLYAGLTGGPIFDPQRFRLTAKDGTVYIIDRTTGLVSATDKNGNTMTVSAAGITTSVGPSIVFTRDPQGRITHLAGPAGEHHDYTYDPLGNLATVTDGTDLVTTFHYDPDHNLVGIDGSSGQPFRTIGYDDSGRLESVTDGEGHTSHFSFDVAARRQITTDALARLNTVDTFDEHGDLIREDQGFDGTTRTTKFEYDPDGNLTKQIDPKLNETTITYDADGNPTSVTDGLHRTIHVTYENGEVDRITDPDGNLLVDYTRDTRGNPTLIDRGLGLQTHFVFNGAGLATDITTAVGGHYHVDHDSVGNVTRIEDSTHAAVSATWDDSKRPLTITTSSGTTHYAYNGNGLVESTTDPLGHAWRYTYDEQDRLLTEKDPLDAVRSWDYDLAGRLVHRIDRNGDTTTFHYDADGRVTQRVVPGGETILYAYDGLGRVIDASNQTAKVSLAYDLTSLVTSIQTQAIGASGIPTTTVGYSYDDAGQAATMTTAAGTTTYEYDPMGRLTQVGVPGIGNFDLGYDALGRTTSIGRPNGVMTAFTWDAASQITDIVHRQGVATLDETHYTYGDGSLRESITDHSGTHTYTYDGLGQLTAVDNPASQPDEAYTYDAAGNRTSSGAAYDAANRQTAGAGASYEFDAEGRLVQRTAGGQHTDYTWDADGRLLGVNGPAGTATYRYDPFGRRIGLTDASGTHNYGFGTGEDTLVEYNGANAPVATYAYGPEVDTPLEMTRGTTASYYLQDAIGNITALTNGAGAVTDRYTYSSFGSPVQGGATTNPFTFGAREFDAASGAYFLRSRYYDPSTGRFLSEDPAGGTNLYPYALNNPVSYRDPMGAQAIVERAELEEQNQVKAAQTERSVYRFYECGEGWYYGMTNNVFRRMAEHGSRILDGTFEELGTWTGWMLVRGIEQAFIDAAGGVGALSNSINSMSPTNPANTYWRAQGQAWYNFWAANEPGWDPNPPAPAGCP